MPDAQGEATVEPKQGSTLIQAHFSDVPPPSRFGSQYLTYVVWAISPEGRAQNLGELVLDASNKGELRTSTPLQTFAMIVTAEPYYSVREPSDAVVMENMVGPGTTGKVEEVNATYELLPRKQFTYDPNAQQRQAQSRKPVSEREYNAIVALYQAQNAIQIAEAHNAVKYAPERLAKARQLYEQARAYPSSLSKEIISIAREATQVAEDSRAIATKRESAERAAEQEQRVTQAREQAEQARVAAEAQRERAAAEAARAAEAQRQAAEAATNSRARAQAQSAPATSTNQPPITVDQRQFLRHDPQASVNRSHLLSALSGFDTLDSPRGVSLRFLTISPPAPRCRRI